MKDGFHKIHAELNIRDIMLLHVPDEMTGIKTTQYQGGVTEEEKQTNDIRRTKVKLYAC
jgi:hypothetical protein